jgi:hypothetical protein
MERDEFAFTQFLSDPSSDGVMSSKKAKPADMHNMWMLENHCPIDDLEWVVPPLPGSQDVFPHSSPLLRRNGNETMVVLRTPHVTRSFPRNQPVQTRKKETDGENWTKRRQRFSAEARNIVLAWMFAHADHPYPSREEFVALERQTGMTQGQLRVFLVNNRSRKLGRKVRSSNVRNENTELLTIDKVRKQ